MIHNPFKIFAFTLIAIGIALPFAFAAYRGLFSPSAPAVTGGNGRTLLRSQDGGASWQRAGLSEDRSVAFPRRITDIAFDPQNSSRMFLGSKGAGLWRSDTAGVSWKKVRDASGALKDNADVFAIALGRGDPTPLSVAAFQDSFGKLFESGDGGASFREIFSLTEERFGIFDAWVHPANPRRLVIITGQGAVLRSDNGGETWRILEQFGEELEQMEVNPAQLSEIFIRTRRGRLFKSVDGGEAWSDITAVVGGQAQNVLDFSLRSAFRNLFSGLAGGVSSLSLDPSVPGRLWVIRSGRLIRSDNGGFSWKEIAAPIDPESGALTAAAGDPKNSRRILAAQEFILYRSEDDGTSWQTSLLGSQERVQTIMPHPHLANVFFAITGK